MKIIEAFYLDGAFYMITEPTMRESIDGTRKRTDEVRCEPLRCDEVSEFLQVERETVDGEIARLESAARIAIDKLRAAETKLIRCENLVSRWKARIKDLPTGSGVAAISIEVACALNVAWSELAEALGLIPNAEGPKK